VSALGEGAISEMRRFCVCMVERKKEEREKKGRSGLGEWMLGGLGRMWEEHQARPSIPTIGTNAVLVLFGVKYVSRFVFMSDLAHFDRLVDTILVFVRLCRGVYPTSVPGLFSYIDPPLPQVVGARCARQAHHPCLELLVRSPRPLLPLLSSIESPCPSLLRSCLLLGYFEGIGGDCLISQIFPDRLFTRLGLLGNNLRISLQIPSTPVYFWLD
jgi:hypothetical protein